jgi:hypothetical protein
MEEWKEMIHTVKQVWIRDTCFEFFFDDIYFGVTVSNGATEHYKILDDSPYIVNFTKDDIQRDIQAVNELIVMLEMFNKRLHWRLKNTKSKMEPCGEARSKALIRKARQ